MTNSNSKVVPEAKDALNRFKYEVANEVGVTLKDGYNGNLSSRDAGKIGGNMVRKLRKSLCMVDIFKICGILL